MRRLAQRVALIVAASALAAAATADGRPAPVVRDVAIENAGALEAFQGALADLRRGARRHVRVMHYGDSNVASDLWTAATRRLLQERFGDGGAGYLVPTPWGSRHDGDVVVRGGRGWGARRLGFARDFGPPDGLWGLAGVAVEGAGRRARLDVRVPAWEGGGKLVVHALGHRRGGMLEVRLDGGVPVIVDTRSHGARLVRRELPLSPSAHQVTVRVATARPVRLLGLQIERRAPGVIYDVLGINGHRMNAMLEWDLDLWRAQMASRQPDLVIMAYGGNEALDRGLRLERYEEHVGRALERMRALSPGASCLVVAPVAMCPRNRRNVAVTAIQRRLAHRHGCGFWHTAEVSGGHGSLCDWIRAGDGLVSGDRLHLGRRGYALVGERFARALLVEGAPPSR